MPFSFTKRKSPVVKPPQPTPADIAAMARDGGVKQVTTSNWETFIQVFGRNVAVLSTTQLHHCLLTSTMS
jgi:hypothetical protein